MRRRTITLLLLGAALSLALLGCSDKDSSKSGAAQPAGDVGAGKVLAEQQCKGCHGANGKGMAPAIPNLAGQRERYLLAALAEYKEGKRSHAALRDMAMNLKDADARNVASYYASLPAIRPVASAASHVSLYDRGKGVAAACASCHGPGGVGDDATTPNLASQDADYLVRSIKAYRSTRKNPEMQRAVTALSDADIDSIAAYYTVQKSRPAENGQRLIEDIVDKCGRCHGGADNPAMVVPVINAQDRDYLVMALRAYRDNRRQSSAMHMMSLPYSDSVIDSIASVYATQPAK
jgi:cytochrome c553